MDRRNALRLAVLGAAGALSAGSGVAAFGKRPPTPSTRDVLYTTWSSDAELGTGTALGVAVSGGALTMAFAAGQRDYNGTTYDYATWTSPMVATGFDATEAVASWNADTPGACWVEVELRGVTAARKHHEVVRHGSLGGRRHVHRTHICADAG
jgi:hypothetical protein